MTKRVRSEVGDMTTGEAAKLISAQVRTVSRQTVRRLVDDGRLRAGWTRPSAPLWTRDAGGYVLRGHRRIDRASLAEYIADELCERDVRQAAERVRQTSRAAREES